MRVGVNLINFGPGVTPASMAQTAELVESLGYHLLMISDHLAVTPDVHARYPAPLYNPFTTLGWLAGITRRVELGTTVVIVPYRHPIETARMVADLDQVSGGRFIFGVGVGWARQEFEALGVPFHHRGAMTDDYLAAMKAVWTQEVATYEGRFVSFRDVRATPAPVRRPHPPIWVGGASDAALRRTVMHGDAWHPIRIRVDWLRDTGLPRLAKVAAELGRPVPAVCPRIRLRVTDAAMPEDRRVAGEGALDQVRADLAALQALGVGTVLLDTYFDDPEATRDHEAGWRMLRTVAGHLVDLPREALR